jgi:hypothetical protein
MKLTKKIALAGTLGAGVLVSLAAWAYPMPGYNQETVATFYSDAARTNVIGVRGVAHDSACDTWHINWGAQSGPYQTVEVLQCPDTNGDPPPFEY